MKQTERTTNYELQTTNSLLWEIRRKGIDKPSYLYGTIHIQDRRVFSFGSIVKEKLLSCEAYAMESVIDEIPQHIINRVFFMKRQTLKDVLNKKTYDELEKILHEKFSLNISVFEKTKPLFIASHLIQFYEYHDMPEALDLFFLKLARENNKIILGIEKPKEQLDAVNKVSIKDQCRMLIDLIKEPERIETKFNDLLEAYLNADLGRIHELSTEICLSADFKNAFLTERNKKMAMRIGRFCKKQPTFSAVGAGHLVGKDGLISLLADKGFTLTPLKFNFNND